MSILFKSSPRDVRFVMIDLKMLELSLYEDLPHLLVPVVTDAKKTILVLKHLVNEMDERYQLLKDMGVRHIDGYNRLAERDEDDRQAGVIELTDPVGEAAPFEPLRRAHARLPKIVIIIDELADLMMTAAKEAEYAITRLAQKSRAVGIHIIMATQRPSVDVITGLIKANMPCRIAFQTSSMVDSRTILDRNGAETLLGAGDMLFIPPGTSRLVRAQGSYTSDKEIRAVTDFCRAQGKPDYHHDLIQKRPLGDQSPQERDELYEDAVRIVLMTQRGSVSLLQRKLEIGYSRAARLIDMMAAQGVVGGYKGSQAREVLFTLDEWEAQRAAQAEAPEEAPAQDEGHETE
jgi:S-DNA-T family DNA segregation ATPase FtsK/SpoIIIE